MSARAATLVCALLLASPVAAQSTPKQATQAANSAGKAETKAFRQAAKAALSTFQGDLSQLEEGFAPGADAAQMADDVAASCVTLLDALHAALDEACAAADQATADALASLGGEGDPPDMFPEGFHAGADGVHDDVRARLEKAAVQAGNAALKRLAKTSQRAEKKAGVGLLATVRFPGVLGVRSVNAGESTEAPLGARLDLLVGSSRLDVPGDGVIAYSGISASPGDVDASLLKAPSIVDSTTLLLDDVLPARFSGVFDASGAGLVEGNYLVLVDQGGGPFDDAGRIGVR